MKKNNIENQILLIFGSNGDLANRKLLPALFQLHLEKLLPEKFIIIGAGSSEKNAETYRNDVAKALSEFSTISYDNNNQQVPEFLNRIYYKRVNNQEATDFESLKAYIYELSELNGIVRNIVYYFSIPPFLYEKVALHLTTSGLNTEHDGWKRIIVEKPYGYSLDSALDLDQKLHAGFNENQIFRIDHYLGKETVQNIMVTRFSNGFFEPIWNRKYIDRIEITASESIGVGGRGGYYDTSGALRDMVQNHLLQVMAIVAMEPPVVFDSDAIRNETVKVLQALRPMRSSDVSRYVVRGQYVTKNQNCGNTISYVREKGVAPNSKTETFVALKVFIDNWRWSDVPFYIRTGKHLPERVTEVVIHLKPAPHQLFKQMCLTEPSNMIVLRIHPDAGVAIDFGMKIPGSGFKVQNVNMAFHYSDLADKKIADAYERLILDCMTGDSTLYARTDAVKASWKYVDTIINAWKNDDSIPIYEYECNSWGPQEVNQLFDDKFMTWRDPVLRKNA